MKGIFGYIDPGTGSMIFAILMGVVSALYYSLRIAVVKLRFFSGIVKKSKQNGGKIPFVIFADDKRYWNVFKTICEEFDRRNTDVVYMTLSKDDPVFECGLSHIKPEYLGEGNKPFMRLNLLNAGIVLSTTPGLDVYQWKRSKNVDYYVHILHSAGDVSLYTMFGLDYYDAVLLAGEHQRDTIRKLEEMRHLPAKELEITGIPYMDEMSERLKKEKMCEGENPKKESAGSRNVSVLLAPSWGKAAIFSRFGVEILEALIKTGYKIIIRPHPQSFASEGEMIHRLMEKYPESDCIEWNRDVDNFDVLRRSDILISDFSGVIWEFSMIFNKPVIYTDFEFDRDVYDCWWLEDKLWTETALVRIGKGLNEENLPAIREMIDDCLSNSYYVDGRREIIEESWQCYGEGTKKTVDYLFMKYDEFCTEKEVAS